MRRASDTPSKANSSKVKSKKAKIPGPTTSIRDENLSIKESKINLVALTDKHLYFCKRYVLNGGNACKAGRESGFTEWYASNQLINVSLIRDEIARYRESRKAKFDISADRIIAELAKVAFGTLGDFVDIQKDGTPIINCEDVGQEEMAAVQEITQDVYTEKDWDAKTDEGEIPLIPVKKTKLKLHAKVPALELLARVFKLYGESGDTDKDSPEKRALKIQAALKAMREVDGL